VDDLTALVPATVVVVFDQPGNFPYAYTRTLVGLDLDEYGDTTGRPDDTHVIRSTAVATDGSPPANDTELANLATTIATDFYLWQLGRMFVRYAGIADYDPEGFHAIEWRVAADGCGTRIQRCPRDEAIAGIGWQSSSGGSSTPVGNFGGSPTGFTPTGTTYSLPTGTTPTTATIATSQNNYALPATSWLQVTTTAAISITGIVAPSTNYFQFVTNNGPFTLTLPHNSGSSTAGNRFDNPGGSSFLILPGQTALLFYDLPSAAWKPTLLVGDPTVQVLNLAADTSLALTLKKDCCPKLLLVNPVLPGKKFLGFDNPVPGFPPLTPGAPVTIKNQSSTITFIVPNEDPGSNYPITTPAGLDFPVGPGESFNIVYDGVKATLTAASAPGDTSGQRYDLAADYPIVVLTALGKIFTVTQQLRAATKYVFRVWAMVDADAAGGVKFSMDSDDGLTATAIIYSIKLLDEGTNTYTVVSRKTALGGSAAQVGTTAGELVIDGSITTNAAGSLNLFAAESAAVGTLTIKKGATFLLWEVP
jgi:hypothetical protein